MLIFGELTSTWNFTFFILWYISLLEKWQDRNWSSRCVAKYKETRCAKKNIRL